MKTSHLLALAVTMLGLAAAPAAATPIDYILNVPLVASDMSGDLPTLALRGTLSYDGDEAMTGRGSFSIGDVSDVFAGLTFLLDLGNGSTGILFDGVASSGSELYMNIATGPGSAASGTVNYCDAGGCSWFAATSASLSPTIGEPIGLPPVDTSPVLPVSPVPLPPAMSLFGGALLAWSTLTYGRRFALRPKLARAR